MAQSSKRYFKSLHKSYERNIEEKIRSKFRRIPRTTTSSRSRSGEHETTNHRKRKNPEKIQGYLNLDDALVNARRFIGINNIEEFYNLTPHEYNLLLKGSLYARYDKLQDQKIISSLPVPMAFADKIEEVQNNIDQAINSIKVEADKIGNEEEDSKKKEKEELFANLFL